MFGHNPFSWVPLRAESIISFKSEGDGEEWRSIPDTASAGYDDDTHEDNGWVADACEANFFLFKGSGDQIGIVYPLDTAYNTGEWWKSVDGAGGADSMMVSGYWAGEPYIDAYTRVLMIVGNHWDGDTDENIDTITTIARPAFGNAKWTWIGSLADIPTNCGVSQACSYSNWSNWSVCDKVRETEETGGKDGTQERTRTVTSGSNCDGELTQTQDCHSPQPCEWGEWSEWSYPEGQSWASARGICGFNNDDIGQVIIRTRTRSVIKAHQGGQAEDLCPDGINETGWSSTQTETETTPCPTSASDCADGEIWRTRMQTQEDGTRVESGKCIGCHQNTDPNANENEYGCKTGCKSGYEDISSGCHIVGCTDPLAKNYDSTATLACNEPKWYGGGFRELMFGPTDRFAPNKCCEYDCDNPLLETDWDSGKCLDTCIDGYLMNSAGECEELCNEGFELIDGECQKITDEDPDDKKTIITTQTDISTVIEPESPNMTPIIGGIAVLGVVGYFLMQRK